MGRYIPDDYDGPLTTSRRPCTCGTWDWRHESFCGQPDPDEDPDEVSLREWQDTIAAASEEAS